MFGASKELTQRLRPVVETLTASRLAATVSEKADAMLLALTFA